MATKRNIRLKDVKFMDYKAVITDECVFLKLRCSATFDQVVAEQLQIKEVFFDNQGMRRDRVHDWGLAYEDHGNQIRFGAPKQLMLGEKMAEALSVSSLRINGFRVVKEKVHGTLNVRFTIEALDDENQLADFVREIRRQGIDIRIEPPTKAQSEAAQRQLGLLKDQEEEEPAEEDEEETEEEEEEVEA